MKIITNLTAACLSHIEKGGEDNTLDLYFAIKSEYKDKISQPEYI